MESTTSALYAPLNGIDGQAFTVQMQIVAREIQSRVLINRVVQITRSVDGQRWLRTSCRLEVLFFYYYYSYWSCDTAVLPSNNVLFLCASCCLHSFMTVPIFSSCFHRLFQVANDLVPSTTFIWLWGLFSILFISVWVAIVPVSDFADVSISSFVYHERWCASRHWLFLCIISVQGALLVIVQRVIGPDRGAVQTFKSRNMLVVELVKSHSSPSLNAVFMK